MAMFNGSPCRILSSRIPCSQEMTDMFRFDLVPVWMNLNVLSSVLAVVPSSHLRIINKPKRVVFPNFWHPALTSSFYVYALSRCCRHATKMNKSPFESWTISKLTVIHNCCKKNLNLQKLMWSKWLRYGRVSEVRVHYPILPLRNTCQ